MRLLVAGLLMGMGCAAAFGQAGSGICDLDKTLAQMDAASAKFKTMQADFTWDQYDAAVRADETDVGTIYFLRHGGTTTMAANIVRPAEKKLTFNGSEVEIYTPGTNEEMIYSVAKNKEQAEGFLTLGFGGSGADLKKSWDVTCAGTEIIGGTPVVQLALVSKQESVKNMFNKVTIWIDPARAISLKQVFEQLSGDKRTNTFTNIKYNVPVAAGVFKIKTAANPAITRK